MTCLHICQLHWNAGDDLFLKSEHNPTISRICDSSLQILIQRIIFPNMNAATAAKAPGQQPSTHPRARTQEDSTTHTHTHTRSMHATRCPPVSSRSRRHVRSRPRIEAGRLWRLRPPGAVRTVMHEGEVGTPATASSRTQR